VTTTRRRTIKQILGRVDQGTRLSPADALALFESDRSDLDAILHAADVARRRTVGDQATFVVNKNVNWTNICVNSCLFCGFSRTGSDSSSYRLSPEDVVERISESVSSGITEVCLVAGLHPDAHFEDYLRLVRAVREAFPSLHIHGITPEEIKHATRGTGMSYRDGYRALRACGLDSIPGTAAEILDDRIRKIICPQKLSSSEWVTAIEAAADEGLRATATILYGHVESMADRAHHLATIREIQDSLGVFTEFVPLSFVPWNTPLYKMGLVSGGASAMEDLLMIAVSRLFLDNIINIQASWVKYGPKLAQLMLSCGANDLGGTLFGESITRSAGGSNNEMLTQDQMMAIIRGAGRIPVQRTTTYEIVETPSVSASHPPILS